MLRFLRTFSRWNFKLSRKSNEHILLPFGEYSRQECSKSAGCPDANSSLVGGDQVSHAIAVTAAGTILAITGLILYVLIVDSHLSRAKFGWHFLFSSTWIQWRASLERFRLSTGTICHFGTCSGDCGTSRRWGRHFPLRIGARSCLECADVSD